MSDRCRVTAALRGAGSVWAEEEAALLVEAARTSGELEALLARRVAGEPLETVLGWVAFLGRRLTVAPGVFVPRRRTELLARTTLARVAADQVVVEMCCGVAPVAALLEGSTAQVHAADMSQSALACAALNAPSARLHLGDLFDALPGDLAGRIDVLVANAPYVPTDRIAAMPMEARDHEPHLALDGGDDGVDVHRRLARESQAWLAPGGVVLIETSRDLLPLTLGALDGAGLVTSAVRDDEVRGCVAVAVSAAGRAARAAVRG